MPERWRAPSAVPGRAVPDPTVAPTGRLGADAVVDEINRLGEWVRVETPEGRRWWVDGRRLERAPRDESGPGRSAEAVPAPEPGLAATPTTIDAEHDSPPSPRRPPLALIAVVAVAVLALVGGAVVLLTSEDPPPEPPTAVTQILTVDVAPEMLAADRWPFADSFWFADGPAFSRFVDHGRNPSITGVAYSKIELDGAEAFAGQDWLLVAIYADGSVIRWDDLDDASSRVVIGDDCCAPMVGISPYPADVAYVFSADRQGRSDRMWVIDFEDGTFDTVLLPRAGRVRDVVPAGGDTVFVALDWGLLALGSDSEGDCRVVLEQWSQPTSALWLATWPGWGLRLLTLDPEAGSISVFDPTGWVSVFDGCEVGAAPTKLGTVDVASAVDRPLDLADASLVAVGEVAYVLTADGELIMVDLDEPSTSRDDRLVGTIPDLGSGSGGASRLAVLQPDSDGPAEVLVAHPDGSLFWVIGQGDENTLAETIDLRETP